MHKHTCAFEPNQSQLLFDFSEAEEFLKYEVRKELEFFDHGRECGREPGY